MAALDGRAENILVTDRLPQCENAKTQRGSLNSTRKAAILFAAFSAIVLGVITKRTDAERLRYGVRCFAYFIAALVGLGWLMYLGHG